MNIFPDATLTAVLGYAVVFVGLVLLMAVIAIMGKIMTAKKPAKQTAPATNDAGNVQGDPVQKLDGPFAPGSAGEVALHGVEPKTAAMIMAIVADQLGKPVNELRFKSIKEVK